MILISISLLACGGDETVTEIVNNTNNAESLSPREQAEEEAQQYNRERRNDLANLRCHVCRKVDDECGDGFGGIDPPPCEWEAVSEQFGEERATIWTTRCVIIEECVRDAFVCRNRCP